MASTNRLRGVLSSLAIKAPCVVASTTNITLSGLQTIGSVTVAEGDRVLVTGQSNPVENGIYEASLTGWLRAADFDGNRDATQGTLVTVYSPSSGNVLYQLTSANPVVIGTSNIAFTVITAPADTSENVGVLLYGNPTAAETAIGMTAYSALNTPGNLVAPQYEPGDVRRYGWGGSASDNRLALQAALNAARCDEAGTNRKVKLPAGEADIDATVYGVYDAANNNVAPSFGTQRYFGRYTIEGMGSGHFSNATNDEARGTKLNFTNATGDGLVLCDYNSGSVHGRDIWAKDFAITGATTGSLLKMRATQHSHLRRLVTYNNASGIALDVLDANTHCTFKQIMVNGSGAGVGTIGIYTDCDVSGGSLNIWEGVMVNDCDIALDLGGAYDGAQTIFAKNATFFSCSFQNSRIGARLRHGFGTLRFIDTYFEGNVGATGASVTITDSCGIDDNDDYYEIVFEDTHFADNDFTAGKQIVQLGATGGSTETDSHGIVTFIRNNQVTAPAGVDFITKYNNTKDGLVKVVDHQFSAGLATGRLIKLMDNAAHYGPVQLKGMAGLADMNASRIWVNSSRNDLHGRWCANGSDIVADHRTDAAADYTNAPALPSVVASAIAGSNTFTLTLPDNANVHEHEAKVIDIGGSASSTIIVDSGSGNTISGDGSSADSDQKCQMDTEAYRRADYWMRAQGEWYVYPVHGTIDMIA